LVVDAGDVVAEGVEGESFGNRIDGFTGFTENVLNLGQFEPIFGGFIGFDLQFIEIFFKFRRVMGIFVIRNVNLVEPIF